MLDPNKININLTENMAMHPASSVSGYYFAHTESRYFGMGTIFKDQIEDYVKRKGDTVELIEKWLKHYLEDPF